MFGAVEINHDVLAAIIGALAIILVAVIPRQIQRRSDGRQDLTALRNEVASLRERLADLAADISTGQERRHAEHEELKQLLRWRLAERDA